MYPRILIDIPKLKNNITAVGKITKEDGNCSMMTVTKCLCADDEVCRMIAKHPIVDYMADSRVDNLKKYAKRAHKHGKMTVLLRIPMHSEVKDVVKYADISFNSELSTIRLLNEAAAKRGIRHKIVLMIDMGDLREGIFFRDEQKIYDTVEAILKMKNIKLYGIGVNLTCYGAIIPKYENLSALTQIARRIEIKYEIKLKMVSGGNSSSIYLIPKKELPEGINNLRLGEAFLLGNDTAYLTRLPGTVDDAIILEAQIVELKEKPSLPIGEVGVDAFGQKPAYEDRGIIKRAIIALGKQDTDLGGMIPMDQNIDILGGSSDHTILDVTKSDKEYKVGDIVRFKLEYGAMLKLATSPYVTRTYIGLKK